MINANINYQEVKDAQEAFELLSRNKIDIAVIPKPMANAVLQSTDFHQFKRSTAPIDRKVIYHFIHKKHQNIVPALTESLKKIVQQAKPNK